MHRIKEGRGLIKSLKGTPFRIVERDDDENVIWADKAANEPKMIDSSVEDILTMLIFRQPPETVTKQDSIHSGRIYTQMMESLKESKKKYIEIEDAEWTWIIKKLDDDKVGPPIFVIHTDAVETSLKELEKLGEEQRKKSDHSGAKKKNANESGEGEGGEQPETP